MNVQDFFIVWQDIGLILYSVLKAFLPLPSLEVILVPLVLHSPQKWLLYSLEGAVGTCIGGAIGYGIARILGKKVLYNIAAKEDVEHGDGVRAAGHGAQHRGPGRDQVLLPDEGLNGF